jgi:DNA-binding protein
MESETYQRWEVYIKHTDNITPYLGYIRALFYDDKREFVMVKARGFAIESALRVIQMVREEMGNIYSVIKVYMQS